MTQLTTTQPPKVSVIVCTYNQEHSIGRTLDSILSQKVDFPYEIILADDCSRDSTLRICEEYAKQHPTIIRLFANKKNKGLVDNYFDSIEECRGEYIADLAGDDIWTDQLKLQKQADIMDSDKEISLCHADWNSVYPDGTIANIPHWQGPAAEVRPRGELVRTLLKHENDRYFIHLCTSMYRRDKAISLMKDYPHLFRNDELVCEDFQLKVLLSYVGKIAYIPDKVLNYTVGAPSISSTEDSLKTLRFYSGALLLTLRVADALKIDRAELNDYCANVMQYIIMQYFADESVEGREIVKKLLRKYKIHLTLKNRLTLLLSHNRGVWRVTNKLRSLRRK